MVWTRPDLLLLQCMYELMSVGWFYAWLLGSHRLSTTLLMSAFTIRR